MTGSGYGIRLRSSARSDRGRVRQNNEDSVHLWSGEHHVLAVVADGMGGAVAGEEASRITVETIQQKLKVGDYRKPGDYATYDSVELGDLLKQSVKEANENIMTKAVHSPELKGMGTTVTLAFARGTEVVFVHVGDSRAYYVDGDTQTIEQVTTDHSFVQALVDAGHLNPEDAKGHPMENVLYRALGQQEDLDIDVIQNFKIHSGDRLVLCSDGLTRHVDPDEISDISLENDDPQTIGDKLIDLANSRGGKDNISVIVVIAEREEGAGDSAEDEASLPAGLTSNSDEVATVPMNTDLINAAMTELIETSESEDPDSHGEGQDNTLEPSG